MRRLNPPENLFNEENVGGTIWSSVATSQKHNELQFVP